MDKVGRRQILIPPMIICAVFLLLASAHSYLPTAVGAIADDFWPSSATVSRRVEPLLLITKQGSLWR